MRFDTTVYIFWICIISLNRYIACYRSDRKMALMQMSSVEEAIHCLMVINLLVSTVTSLLLFFYCITHGVSKNIPDIFDSNLNKNYQILILFGVSISDTTCHQVIIQFSTSPNVCFCTT